MANSVVPKFTVIIGNSFGAGNYGMNGRSYDPNFLFTYPNAKIGVMGSEQLAGVMNIIQKASAKASGIPYDEENAKMIQQMLINEAESKASAWHSTSELWDDGVIDPRETRNYLGFAFAVLYNQKIEGAKSYGVWRM